MAPNNKKKKIVLAKILYQINVSVWLKNTVLIVYGNVLNVVLLGGEAC